MALDFDGIESAMAAAISSGLADSVNGQLGEQTLPASTLPQNYSWTGGIVVWVSDTSDVAVDDYIRYDSDGRWYRISFIFPNIALQVQDTFSTGGFPAGSGAGQTSKADLPPAPPMDPAQGDTFAEPIAAAVRAALETFAADAEINDVQAGGDQIGPGVIT